MNGKYQMATLKVATTIDAELLGRLDVLVERRVFSSRSRAIQEAVQENLERLAHTRLARVCAKLDRKAEQAIANEDLAGRGTQGSDQVDW
jgi:metal-responsive CopG/Arc/MetJ family transcriptional regulator